jgi:hypothetical protein
MATLWQKIYGETNHGLVTYGPEVDSFGRIRVCQPHTLFNGAQVYDNLPLLYEQALTGTGGATHSVNLASTAMSVTAAGAGTAVRQSRAYLPYRAANSQVAFFTSVLGTCAAGVTKRVGLFDANNGLFLEQTSAGLALVVRSYTGGSVEDTRVIQSAWNLDTLDGSGARATNPTGLMLDPTKTQIFWVQFQWLGVGRVTFGVDIQGQPVPVHYVDHANTTLAKVYMSTPNLPVRYEIRNADTGGGSYNAGSLTQICAAVSREGAEDDPGYEAAVSRGATSATAADGVLTSLLGVRLSSTHIRARLIPKGLQVLNTGSVPVRYVLSINPTTTGSFADWAAVGAGLASQASLTVLPVTAAGLVLEAGYVAAGTSAGPSRSAVAGAGLSASLDVLASIAGVSDVLVLSAAGIGGTAVCYASLRWAEVY